MANERVGIPEEEYRKKSTELKEAQREITTLRTKLSTEYKTPAATVDGKTPDSNKSWADKTAAGGEKTRQRKCAGVLSLKMTRLNLSGTILTNTHGILLTWWPLQLLLYLTFLCKRPSPLR